MVYVSIILLQVKTQINSNFFINFPEASIKVNSLLEHKVFCHFSFHIIFLVFISTSGFWNLYLCSRPQGYANIMMCSSLRTFLKIVQRQLCSQTRCIVSQTPHTSFFSFSNGFSTLKHNHMYANSTNRCFSAVDFRSFLIKPRTHYHSLTVKNKVNANVKALLAKQGIIPKGKCNMGPLFRSRGGAFSGLFLGLLVGYSTYEPIKAEAAKAEDNYSHGKKVYNDYSITGIPGDGRCLFRSVAHGACLRLGKSAPNESFQRELADDLRAKVADEFVKRRKETEWFVEGDFDTYVSHIRKPHVWGGEPELFMASHVLRMPITVYMYDKDHGGLISIAEYGEEYGKDYPIRVLYHGFGHYDALQIHCNKGTAQSKL